MRPDPQPTSRTSSSGHSPTVSRRRADELLADSETVVERERPHESPSSGGGRRARAIGTSSGRAPVGAPGARREAPAGRSLPFTAAAVPARERPRRRIEVATVPVGADASDGVAALPRPATSRAFCPPSTLYRPSMTLGPDSRDPPEHVREAFAGGEEFQLAEGLAPRPEEVREAALRTQGAGLAGRRRDDDRPAPARQPARVRRRRARRGVPGDLIETGVWRGGATIFMRAVLAAYGDTDRRLGGRLVRGPAEAGRRALPGRRRRPDCARSRTWRSPR